MTDTLKVLHPVICSDGCVWLKILTASNVAGVTKPSFHNSENIQPMNDRRDTSPRNLASLFSSMKNYVEAKTHGVKFSQGKPQNVPDKYCPICAAVFGSAPPEVPLLPKLCGICADKLKAGHTALVCGNRYVFVLIPEDNVQSYARGRISKVTPDEMDAMEREYKDQVKQKENGQQD